MIKKHIKLFDMRNPNCTFINTPTPEMFHNHPVMLSDKHGNKEIVVGVIADIDSIVYLGYEIYGDIIMWEDRDIKFKGYGVSGKSLDESNFKIEWVTHVDVEYNWD